MVVHICPKEKIPWNLQIISACTASGDVGIDRNAYMNTQGAIIYWN